VIAIIPNIVRAPDITSSNLKSVAAGNSTQIKVGYAPRHAVAEQNQGSGAAPAAPPATAPPLSSLPSVAAPPATAPPTPAGPPVPGGPARVSFLPANSVDTQLSQAFTVQLYAENVRDLTTAAGHLQYDPRILRITDIKAGDLPQKNGSVLQPSKNILNDAGTADFSISRGPNDGGASGSGNLFSIVFQAVGRGNTSVAVSGVSLAGVNGQAINSNSPPALAVNVR
jgi:hypothetical protein